MTSGGASQPAPAMQATTSPSLLSMAMVLREGQLGRLLELPDFDRLRVVATYIHRSSSGQERLLLRRRIQALSVSGHLISTLLQDLLRPESWEYLDRVAGWMGGGDVGRGLNNLRHRLVDLIIVWRGALGNQGGEDFDDAET